VSVLLVLALATPAHADPRALARSAGVLAIAPGGDRVLVAQARGANLRVVSIPLAGGAARLVFSFDAPKGLVPVSASLSASAQRAALILEMGPGPGQPEAVQTFTGPLAGGWVTLQPFTRPSSAGAVTPLRQQADGDRLFTTESRGEDTRVVVRDPNPREVAFAEGEAEYVARFAGDFVATSLGGEQKRSRLVVRDWRTGVVTTSAEVPDGFDFIALRPDGRAAVLTYDGALYEVPSGGPARPLATYGGSAAAYAGDALVHDPDGRLRVIDLSGRSRAFGVPTRSLEGFATEGSQVVWIANGCLLVDDVGAPAAAAPGPGPCVRGELAFEGDQPNPYLTRRLPVALRCVAAPGACRGKLRLGIGLPGRTKPISGRVPFSIRAGHARSVRVPLTCRGYRMILRELRRDARAAVTLDARTEDGQRFPVDLWFEVPSGPADPSRRCGEPPPPDPTGLPASIDVGPLRGKIVPGTPCRVRRKLQYGNPGDHTVRVWLTCAVADDIERLGFVEVERVQSSRELPEDTLRCSADIDRDGEPTGLHSCDLWHARITLDVRALCVRRCNAAKHARAKAAAPATMARLVKWLATMPERPCRLCTK
jgi:hypothetical protein